MTEANDKAKKTITTKTYKISKDKYGIIHRQVIEDAHIDLTDAAEGEVLSLSLNGGKKMLALIDASKFHTLTPTATKYLERAHSTTRIATAVVSKSLSQKIIATAIKHSSVGTTSIQVFATKTEAVKWLRTLK